MNGLHYPASLQLHDNLTADRTYQIILLLFMKIEHKDAENRALHHLFLLKSQWLAVRVGFDAASVVRSGVVQDLH